MATCPASSLKYPVDKWCIMGCLASFSYLLIMMNLDLICIHGFILDPPAYCWFSDGRCRLEMGWPVPFLYSTGGQASSQKVYFFQANLHSTGTGQPPLPALVRHTTSTGLSTWYWSPWSFGKQHFGCQWCSYPILRAI